jgi:saccharopine dehydrogenase-like NADP-dependent oxidoreductase
MNPTIVICGAGGIGRATALILACNPAMYPKIYIGDISSRYLGEAMTWISEGKSRPVEIKSFLMPLEGSNEEMDLLFAEADVILDCLPGSQAPRIAKLAKVNGAHYANLTEYVAETDEIIEIARYAKTAFLLQTGIAPGYVNVLACALHEEFREKFGVDHLEEMKMRVGALSESANAPSYYACTWSMIGVATEYVKDTIIVQDGEVKKVPSLSKKEQIIVNGEVFEDNYTSGGAANLPEALSTHVKNLDYKTLRYPGHYDWVAQSLKNLAERDNLSKELDEFMQQHVPSVENDRIVMYAMVSGKDKNGILRAIGKSYDINPTLIGSKILRAIQATTASSLCEAAFYLIRKNPIGPILQTDINPKEFLNGPYVSDIYGPYS